MTHGIRVPLLDLHAQYRPIRDELLAAVTSVCDSQRFVMGPEIDQLERELARSLQVSEAIAVSSGTDAILVSLTALGVGPGDEVITTPYSFFATAGCIARLGATPRFVDIDPVSYAIDPALIRNALSSRTRAILPVHLFGLCADMDPILAIAAEAGVPVVEDACQAIGASYKGRQAGSMGIAGCFSFFPSKNLGGFGDGGLVTTSDPALARQIRLLRNHGSAEKYVHPIVGGNFRLDEIQAAVLRVKLPHLARWTAMRRTNAATYARLFDDGAMGGRVTRPVEPPGRTHIFNQYVVRVPERDRVRAFLAQRGIATEIYYPVPLHAQECFRALGHAAGDFPEAEAAARSTLALPVYGELRPEQLAAVAGALADAIAQPASSS